MGQEFILKLPSQMTKQGDFSKSQSTDRIYAIRHFVGSLATPDGGDHTHVGGVVLAGGLGRGHDRYTQHFLAPEIGVVIHKGHGFLTNGDELLEYLSAQMACAK